VIIGLQGKGLSFGCRRHCVVVVSERRGTRGRMPRTGPSSCWVC